MAVLVKARASNEFAANVRFFELDTKCGFLREPCLCSDAFESRSSFSPQLRIKCSLFLLLLRFGLLGFLMPMVMRKRSKGRRTQTSYKEGYGNIWTKICLEGRR